MTQAGEARAALVRALGPPLEFLAATDFTRVDRVRLSPTTLAGRLAEARAEERDPGAVAVLDELRAIVEAVGETPAAADAQRLRRAHALLARLRATERGGGDYQASAGAVEGMLAALAAAVTTLGGVGPRRAAELERFGLGTVEDVLYHLPFRYEDRRTVAALAALRVGDEVGTHGTVVAIDERIAGRRGRRRLEVLLAEDADALLLVWFNQVGYFARRFRVGQHLFVHGRVEPPMGNGPARMVHPTVSELGAGEDPGEHAGVVPVYEKPTGMPLGAMRRIAQAAVRAASGAVPAVLPPDTAARQRVIEPARALAYLHQPPPEADVDALSSGRTLAHRSLAFDELFFLQLGLALRRRRAGREPGRAYPPSTRLVPALRAGLPFRLTAEQERAITEIVHDLGIAHPMRRLLQGDVGSGKTLVALVAALTVVEAGWQAVLMAPTELLAEQHHDTIRTLVTPLGIETRLLTGSVRGRARAQVLAGLESGRVHLLIGTQALIQEGVPLARVGLAIVDEQHRFGVLQRAQLQRGGPAPGLDILVMSATPIPRTLALTLYGDLDVSTIEELPPGRTPIRTELRRERDRAAVYDRVREAVAAGHQAYVVFPLVEESDRSELRAATTMIDELRAGPLAGLRLALVHGRMRADEKDAVMRHFKAGEVDVLVSTTVIEVGIDVPNATMMVIEHADRFGLAQLHQLRGRVGRGTARSTCCLVAPDWMSDETFERLRILEATTNGFRLAEADLALRGPGDFLGTRQAGLPPFRVASLVRDAGLLRAARDEAVRWLETDPTLTSPASRAIVAVLEHRWAGRLELARVG